MALLEFTDKKVDGWFPIDDDAGRRVAATSRGGFIEQFVSVDATNRAIVKGNNRPLNGWAAQDGAGRDIVTVQTLARREWAVSLPLRSITALLRGDSAADWTLAAEDGRVLLSSAPDGTSLFHPDSWAVQTDGTLSLPELVGVVELHRLEVKGKRHHGNS